MCALKSQYLDCGFLLALLDNNDEVAVGRCSARHDVLANCSVLERPHFCAESRGVLLKDIDWNDEAWEKIRSWSVVDCAENVGSSCWGDD
jgi:hypothetical protein